MLLNNVKLAAAAITLLLASSASAQPIRHFHRHHVTVVEAVRPVVVVHRRPRVIVERRVIERRIVDRRVVGRR